MVLLVNWHRNTTVIPIYMNVKIKEIIEKDNPTQNNIMENKISPIKMLKDQVIAAIIRNIRGRDFLRVDRLYFLFDGLNTYIHLI